MAWWLYSWAFIPDKWKFMFTQKSVHDVHSSLIYNSPKQPTCPSKNEWLNFAISILWNAAQPWKGTILIHTTWMALKGIMLNKKNQRQKDTWEKKEVTWFHLYNITEMMKLYRDGGQTRGCQRFARKGGCAYTWGALVNGSVPYLD